MRSLNHSEASAKKSVSFNEAVMVRPVLHRVDYTDQERRNCWLVPADKQRTKIDIINIIRLFREGNFDECTRGLERLLDGGRTRDRRRISMREVLEEQESQRANTVNQCEASMVYDFAKLRKVYRPYSRSARHVAHAMGNIDEMTAEGERESVPHTCTTKCKPNTRTATTPM